MNQQWHKNKVYSRHCTHTTLHTSYKHILWITKYKNNTPMHFTCLWNTCISVALVIIVTDCMGSTEIYLDLLVIETNVSDTSLLGNLYVHTLLGMGNIIYIHYQDSTHHALWLCNMQRHWVSLGFN